MQSGRKGGARACAGACLRKCARAHAQTHPRCACVRTAHTPTHAFAAAAPPLFRRPPAGIAPVTDAAFAFAFAAAAAAAVATGMPKTSVPVSRARSNAHRRWRLTGGPPPAAGPQLPFPNFRLGNDSERKRLGNDSERKLERLGSDSERKRLENDWERFVARSCVAAEGGSNPDSEPPGATRSDSELNPSVRDGRVTLQLGAA